MRIVFLCKRRPQGKDLIERPYGRFYYLPELLSRKGHDVQILLNSHKYEPHIELKKGGIRWNSISLVSQGPLAYFNNVNKIIKLNKPDWVIGFSDTYYGIIAQHLAQRHGCKSLIDAYDNYESYISWLKPLHYMWRRALAKADMITAAGPQLAEMMQRDRSDRLAVVLPMAADPEFIPMNRYNCRTELGLPQEKKLIGFCGSLYRSRGVEFLFQLADRICEIDPRVAIVASGRKEKGLKIPPNIRWLGYLPDNMVPFVLSSMNVLLVLNRDSSFGHYSYPVKLYEAMKCGIPVVASETASTSWILGGDQRYLARIDDLDDFSAKLFAALESRPPIYKPTASWEKVADKLEEILLSRI